VKSVSQTNVAYRRHVVVHARHLVNLAEICLRQISADNTSSAAGGFSLTGIACGNSRRGFCPLRWLMAPAARWRQISADVVLERRLAAAHARQCQSLVRVLVYQASV
jgi:hypothetical protein